MNTKFNFGRVYTLLYYLIVLPFSILFIWSLLLKKLGDSFKEEYFVLNGRSELFSYYLPQYFQIKSYMLYIPIFLLTTIFLTPKHFNLRKFLVINIIGVILVTLLQLFWFQNELARWDKLTDVAKDMNNIRYEHSNGSFPAYPGYTCVSFDINPSQKVETRSLITERIKNTNPNLVFNYRVGQQVIYDLSILDSTKNDLRGSVCYP